ncbi:hypothetical protein D0862_13944 [Hortaea werneckii]|uniref:Glycosyl hydrolases family 2 sugar binding domain-containing protein n=1 Tax=Hortaea werneckii TaxID=91943 RepID=A0A3M7EFL6_HORWE|nr:hypothetical protein D0862_13944 [Hortaea werneckii]
MLVQMDVLCKILSIGALASTALAWNPNDQVGADIDYGTFQTPSAYVRPRFRYWIPDASVPLEEVAADFAKVKAIGMGGMELLGYYLYGNFPTGVAEGGPTPVDWTEYGWGTDAWKALQDTALRATKENGLIMDLTMGPNQGAGVPAETNDPGIMWVLWPFNVSVPIGGTFDNILPGWGEIEGGEFVAATVALLLEEEDAEYTAMPAWEGPFTYNGTRRTVAASSLKDVTSHVNTANGHLSWNFPADSTGLEYQVFAFYRNHSNYHEQAPPWYVNSSVPQSPVETYRQNGSWIVDHFSPTGAQLIIDFWEKYLLGNGSRELIREVGNYIWEDSAEFGAGTLVWYTPSLFKAFQSARGYDLTKYLPLIYQFNTEAPGPLASPDHYFTDEADGGMAHINDYRQTLTEMYQVYLSTLTNWSMDALHSQFSAQVAYNLHLDVLADIPEVNAPETESLGFNHLIDGYRQYAGPASLAGKRIVSSELGAQREEVYSQTMPELIWDVKRSVVGSINNFVLHAYPFSGAYPNTTWPGFTTFTYRFSNMHGPRQPTWDFYPDYMDWIARTQYVAQSGIPKMDLAFYLKQDSYSSVENQYEPLDLQIAGFSYEYLSPDNFHLADAVVSDGVLAPQRQAFKALILRGNDTLTVAGTEKLVRWANEGLPIIVSGGLPQNLTGYDTGNSTAYVRSALASIFDLDNVHVVPYDNLASSLMALGFTPRTSVSAENVWYTYWREDADKSIVWTYVYNDGWDYELGEGASTGTVTYETTGVPYLYDAWTGASEKMYGYQQTETSTIIPLTLAGNQSIIIGFHCNESTPDQLKLPSVPPEVYSISETEPNSAILNIKAGQTTDPILLPNGTRITLPPPPAPTQLTNWTLTLESWTPPIDLFTHQTASVKTNTTHHLTRLEPWNQLSPSLRNVSGKGYYHTTFPWPPIPSSQNNSSAAVPDGAILDLGALTNAARAWVNGNQLPPLDPTHARTDIGPYLVEGANEVEVVIGTTLGNVLRPIYEELVSSGTRWLGSRPVEQGYGLVRGVRVVPYVRREVDLRG